MLIGPSMTSVRREEGEIFSLKSELERAAANIALSKNCAGA